MGFPASNRHHQPEWSDRDDADFRDWYEWCRFQYLLRGDDPHVQHTLRVDIKQGARDDGRSILLGRKDFYPWNNHQRGESYRFDGDVELGSDYL